MEKAAFLKILKNKNFCRLWAAQILAQVSAFLLNFVLMVRIYEETGSTTALGLFLLVYTAPSIFLGLFAGAFIDLWSKRRVLIISSLAQAFIVLSYLGVKKSVWPIYAIVFLYSLCDEFFGPAEAAILPALVKKESLTTANSLFLFTGQGAILVGSILGGPVIKYLGPQVPFILTCFFLLLGALAAFFLPKDKAKKAPKASFEDQIKALVEDIGEGYRFISRKPRVFYPFLFYMVFQILVSVSIILFPSMTSQILKIDVKDAGLAVLLPVGFGAISGAIYLNKKFKDWGRKKLISVGWLVAGTCFLIISLVIPRVPLPVLFAFPTLYLLGLGTVLVIVTSLTMIQENTPEEIRGRVFGALGALMIISAYLPVFFLAIITDFFGVTVTIFLIGLVVFLTGIISYKIDRRYVLRTSHRA
jgi:MFS family permease